MKIKIVVNYDDPTTRINEYKDFLDNHGMTLNEIYDYYQTLYEVFAEETSHNDIIKIKVATELTD